MLYFCTCSDSGYLAKGVCLYRSLVRHAAPFRLWVLCFDDVTYGALRKLALPEIIPISLSDFEHGDEQLLQAKGNRSRVEYYFTCKPTLPLYILRNWPEVDVITYADSDLEFFSDPSPIYRAFSKGSLLVVPHRFPDRLSHLTVFGTYNAGFLSFRRDETAMRALHWWRESCLEWCYDRVEDGRFADQKYLDEFPHRFKGVVSLQHKGANLAPWNLTNYSLRLVDGKVTVDSEQLIFFHFQGLRQFNNWLYDPGLASYRVRPDGLVKRDIYGPYVRDLRDATRTVSELVDLSFPTKTVRGRTDGRAFRKAARRGLKKLAVAKRLVLCELLLVIGERVL
ncbi:glycosyl transferase [Candidatus Bathyarchaeota archaeon]|nr:glycosyl transferase [Candidatus Bathyarchaeota archaeon]